MKQGLVEAFILGIWRKRVRCSESREGEREETYPCQHADTIDLLLEKLSRGHIPDELTVCNGQVGPGAVRC